MIFRLQDSGARKAAWRGEAGGGKLRRVGNPFLHCCPCFFQGTGDKIVFSREVLFFCVRGGGAPGKGQLQRFILYCGRGGAVEVISKIDVIEPTRAVCADNMDAMRSQIASTLATTAAGERQLAFDGGLGAGTAVKAGGF